MVSEVLAKDLIFLKDMALDHGAVDAAIIKTDKIVVEDRIVFKCRVGCRHYGKSLACPPYVPTAEQFRKIVSDYSYALFVKFSSTAKADVNLAQNLSKAVDDPSLSKDTKEQLKEFWALWNKDKMEHLSAILELEKAAMRKGFPLATGLVAGFCRLCEKCTLDRATCTHPTKARISEEAVGVNVQATAKNAGIVFTYPYKKNPESFALILID
jgi:predicted metal-binding protein